MPRVTLLIFHFIIKLLPHSACLSFLPYGSFQPSHSSSFLFPSGQLTSSAISQFNSNDILHCMQELSSLVHSKNILIVYIQESKLKLTKILTINSFPNYTAVRKDRLVILRLLMFQCSLSNIHNIVTRWWRICHPHLSLHHLHSYPLRLSLPR